jgi:hypothetical protein
VITFSSATALPRAAVGGRHTSVLRRPIKSARISGIQSARISGTGSAEPGVHVGAQLLEPAVDGLEPAVDGLEPAVDGLEPAFRGEPHACRRDTIGSRPAKIVTAREGKSVRLRHDAAERKTFDA